MRLSSNYRIYGYLEAFPTEIGFVTPVFSNDDKLFIESMSEGVIDKLIEVSSIYQSLIVQYNTIARPEINLQGGDRCWYGFKFLDVVYFGTPKTIVNILKRIISNDWKENENAKQIAIDFIDEFDYEVIETKSESAITVMIVDDQTLIRETWEYLLNKEQYLDVIAALGDGERAIEIAGELKPDIILLDIHMVPLNGFDILKKVRKVSPGSKVIVVSMHSQPSYVKKMLRLGAKGYVTKNSPRKEMKDAISAVLLGDIYVCHEIKNIVSVQMLGEDENNPELNRLSEREIEVIYLIREGLTSKEIAAKLNLNLKTIEVHRHNILKKLKVKNTVALLAYISSNGSWQGIL